jgi:transketolase
MRKAFISSLCNLAEKNQDIVLLCGDLGYSVLEEFSNRFPDRYFNVGIAEQNMAGVAAGLALSGKIVFTYSIANFAITRCLEQIRNDICYHNAHVIIVAVGTGVAYGAQGYTHHGIEDLSFTRVLPNITVASPGDPLEVKMAMRHLVAKRGPAILRLGRGGESAVHFIEPTSIFGKLIKIYDGAGEVVFIASGTILPEVVAACDLLKAKGFEASLFSMPVITPINTSQIQSLVMTAKLLISVEEHLIDGGIGSALAEIIAEMPSPRARLLRLGIPRGFTKLIGDQNYLRKCYGLDSLSIANKVAKVFS